MLDKIKEYSALLTMVAVFIAGWLGHGLYSDSVTKAIAVSREAAAQSAAEEIAKITTTNNTIQNKTIERVRTELVYTSCVHSTEEYADIRKAFGEEK